MKCDTTSANKILQIYTAYARTGIGQATEEGWRAQQSKRCAYNNQDENAGPNSKVYNNNNFSFEKFSDIKH